LETEKNKTRCFIAIDFPKEAINYIKEIQTLINKKNLFIGKFTELENLHLTLKFLGEIENSKIEKVKKNIREIKFNEFEASFGEIGVFSKEFVKIIWIKLNGKKLFKLQRLIDEKLKEIFEPEQRFMSHITIARVKKIKNKKELFDYIKSIRIKKIKFKVKCFFLKKSQLNLEGPVYENIEENRLISIFD